MTLPPHQPHRQLKQIRTFAFHANIKIRSRSRFSVWKALREIFQSLRATKLWWTVFNNEKLFWWTTSDVVAAIRHLQPLPVMFEIKSGWQTRWKQSNYEKFRSSHYVKCVKDVFSGTERTGCSTFELFDSKHGKMKDETLVWPRRISQVSDGWFCSLDVAPRRVAKTNLNWVTFCSNKHWKSTQPLHNFLMKLNLRTCSIRNIIFDISTVKGTDVARNSF